MIDALSHNQAIDMSPIHFIPQLRIDTSHRHVSFSAPTSGTKMGLENMNGSMSAPVYSVSFSMEETHQESRFLTRHSLMSLWRILVLEFLGVIFSRTIHHILTVFKIMTWPMRQLWNLCSQLFSSWRRMVWKIVTWPIHQLFFGHSWKLIRSGFSCYGRLMKVLFFWSGFALIAFWYLSCCWEYFYFNLCDQPGFSQLSFCPPYGQKFKINETIISTHNNYTDIIFNASLMHAFPDFMDDLRWGVANLKRHLALPVLVLIQPNLSTELENFFLVSSRTEYSLARFNRAIFHDVDFMLNSMKRMIDRLNRAETMQRKSLSNFLCCIFAQPTPRVSAGTSAGLEVHFQTLQLQLEQRIENGKSLFADFHKLTEHLNKTQDIIRNGKIQLDDERTAIIRNRPYLRQLLAFMVASSDTLDVDYQLNVLRIIRDILAQGACYIQQTILAYNHMHKALSVFEIPPERPEKPGDQSTMRNEDLFRRDAARRHQSSFWTTTFPWTRTPSWTDSYSPSDLAILLNSGTRRLKAEYMAWARVLAEDDEVLRREREERKASMWKKKKEFNVLTRKIGLGGAREAWQRGMGGVW